MIGEILVAIAFGQEFQVLSDQPGAAAQQEGDLPDLHLPPRQLHAALEGREVVGHRRRRVLGDPADLRGRLSGQSQTNDPHAMSQDRPDVVDGAAQRNGRVRVGFPQDLQVAADRAERDEEHAIRQVLSRQQGALAEGLLAKLDNAPLPESRRSAFLQQAIILGAAMKRQADGLLPANLDGLASRLVGADGHQSDLPRRRLDDVRIEEGQIDFLDHAEDGLGLEG
jgi:hypothetical protein